VVKKAKQNGNVGVVLCDCGGTLRGRLDFDRLQKHLEQLPAVATVKLCSRFCRQNECTGAIKSISKRQARRVVIGACDQQNFQSSIANGLLWCVNIREHCAWVTSTPEAATDKAIEVLTAAVRRVKLAAAVKSKMERVNQNVLVLGGGVAAMETAVAMSQLGHRVTLVHKGEKLGGLAAEMPQLYAYVASDSSDAGALVQSRVDELIGQVKNEKRVRVVDSASLESVKGQFGNFTAVVNSGDKKQAVSAGALVLAVGSPCGLDISSVGLENPTVSGNLRKLVQIINDGAGIPRRIAIVMDILGEQGLAISAQVLSGAELLVKRFAAVVKLYCRNVRVAATGLESLYKRAREAGVVVVKYESPPAISEQGTKVVVRVEEPLIGYEVSEEFDLVVMADTPTENGNSEYVSLLEGLRAGPEGALQYDNVWLLPTKTNREGIFVAGSARGNSELRDAQADGLAVANQIHELLKNKQIEVLDDAAVVDGDKCVLCLTCMRVCPHGAVSIDVDNKTASVSAIECQRCGICAVQCPTAAIQLPRYTDDQVAAEVGDIPRVTVFACENSAYPAATAAGINGCEYNPTVHLIRVPCVGKVDAREVLRVLECGAEKVIILGCHLESCQYLTGSTRAAKRIERLTSMLEKAGIDNERVVFGQLASVEPGKFLEYVKE